MKVIITGGLGFLGRLLTGRLLERGALSGPDGQEEINEILLFDNVAAPAFSTESKVKISIVQGDMTDREAVEGLFSRIGGDTVSIFHYAAVMSGIAEIDTSLGYRINLDGIFHVLEAGRKLRRAPRVVFASTIGVYGGTAAQQIVFDTTKHAPQTSYGAAKAMGELLINDYTRKGFIDGRAARLPTIIIRPGAPFAGGGSFASDVIREPLAGRPCVLPVGQATRVAVLGYRSTIECFIALHELDSSALGSDRALNLPNLQCDVRSMIDAVRRVAAETGSSLGHISVRPDPRIERIVSSWPVGMDYSRAQELKLPSPEGLEGVIKEFITDFLQDNNLQARRQ